MCEVDITTLFTETETWGLSGSMATHGPNVVKETWENAKREAPLLKTEDELDAMRQWAKESGGWTREEISAWSDQEVNALFTQLVVGDMRESGLEDRDLTDVEAWETYEEGAEAGQWSGNIFKTDDGCVFYYLGN